MGDGGGRRGPGLAVGDPRARVLTPDEQTEYVGALSPELRAILASTRVTKGVMADLSYAGYREVGTFVNIGDSKGDIRAALLRNLGLDHVRGTAVQQVAVAQVVSAWEAAKVRAEARAAADAEAAAARMPRVMGTGEWQQARTQFEAIFGVLKDSEAPGLPLMEKRVQEDSDEDFQADKLSEVLNKEQAAAEPLTLQATRAGDLRVRRGNVTVPMPKDPEAFRRVLKVLSVSYVWLRIKNPAVFHL